MSNDQFYNVEYQETTEWATLVTNPAFNIVRVKINKDIEGLQKEIDKLISVPTLDNSIQVVALGKAKEKLSSLLRYFDWMLEKKLRLDNEVAKRKIINPQ